MSEEGFTVFPSGYVSLFKLSKEELEERKNRPGLQKFLNKVGSALSEGNIGGFEGQVKGFSKTPAEAKAEFDRIMADPEDAYWAGARNRRNDMKWCKENGKSYVSEDERLARVRYVNSLLKMQG